MRRQNQGWYKHEWRDDDVQGAVCERKCFCTGAFNLDEGDLVEETGFDANLPNDWTFHGLDV